MNMMKYLILSIARGRRKAKKDTCKMFVGAVPLYLQTIWLENRVSTSDQRGLKSLLSILMLFFYSISSAIGG
jgi:hypothetical protein